MRVILRFLAILFGGIADGLASFDRVMRDYNEFCEGMRTMNMRQRVKELEAGNAQTELAIAALREGLEQALCDEHVPVAVEVLVPSFPGFDTRCYRLKCSKCGKVLVDRLGTEEYLNFKVKESGENAISFQEQLEKLLSDKTGDE